MSELVGKFYFTFINGNNYKFFLEGLKITLILTLGSFIFGALLAVGICVLERSKSNVVSKVTKLISNFFVQLPTMVMLMIFVYIIFGSSGLNIIIVVIMALTIKAASYLAEIFSTAIGTVSVGEIEAARTLGMSKWKSFKHVVLPQAVKAALPLCKNQFIATMQETSVVGYLAVMDLTKASSVVTARTLDAFFGLIAISALYLILGYIGTSLLGLLGIEKHIGGQLDD